MTIKILVLLMYLLFCVPLALNAKSKKDKDNSEFKTFLGEWKTNGAVTKLYDTPLGEVFIFAPTLPAFRSGSSGMKQKKKYDIKVHSIQFELYKNSKERKDMKRYIAIDLKIRVFPAISKIKNPKLYFRFTRSMNGANSIKTIFDISGESTYRNSSFFSIPHIFLKEKKIIKIEVEPNAHLGRVPLKAYEVRSIRMIIDRFEDGIISSNIDGSLYMQENKYPYPNMRYSVRSFGICLNLYMPKRRFIMEISKPRIMFTDNPKDLRELPALKREKYPYPLYLLKKTKKGRNLKRLKNPDEIYARALHLLEGKNLVEGVKLLTYIAKQKEHILAMNQLGICYWRGIGVKQDIKKALEWFERAGEYKLPEALNLGGVLKLKNASKPYINKQDKGYIFRMLKSWNIKRKRDPNELINPLFWTDIFSGPKRSPKSDYWEVRDRYLGLFYHYKAYYIEPAYAHSFVNGYFRKDLIEKSILDEFDMLFEKRMKKLDKGIKEKFSVAIYYKGQLLIARSTKEKRKSTLKKALALFKRGEKLGNIECAIEVLHCKARLGLLKTEDFDAELYAKFSDHPLYYLLQYITKNPNAPGVKEFLSRDYRAARRIWQKKPDPMSRFLLALEGIYRFFHYGMDTAYYRMYYDDIDDIKIAYKHLDAAVEAKIQNAVYLKGVYLLSRLYNSPNFFRGGGIDKGINLLEKVAKTGNIKAQFHLVKYYFNHNATININWLKQLKALRDLEFPEAWMLSSNILARSQKGNIVNKKVIGAYKKAASLGCFRAWDRLAMLYYKNGRGSDTDKAVSEKYWKKFLEADKKQRRNDPFDPYWSNPVPVETIKSYSDGSLETISVWKMTIEKATCYFRKFYSFDHLKVIKVKDDPGFAADQTLKGMITR